MKHEIMPFLFVLREKAKSPTAIIIAGSNHKGISSFVHALIINLNRTGKQQAKYIKTSPF